MLKRRLKHLFMLMFFFFCPLAVISVNLPKPVSKALVLPEKLEQAAHAVGLDQLYIMFSQISRTKMDLTLTAVTSSGEKQNLSWQEPFFFGHKSGRLFFNFRIDHKQRRSYLDYLCRTWITTETKPQQIVFQDLEYKVLDRDEARQRQTPYDSQPYIRVYDAFSCTEEGSP